MMHGIENGDWRTYAAHRLYIPKDFHRPLRWAGVDFGEQLSLGANFAWHFRNRGMRKGSMRRLTFGGGI